VADKKTLQIRFEGGVGQCVYSEEAAARVAEIPQVRTHITRASHVEPDNDHVAGGNWFADLKPVGDSKHYVDEAGKPFMTRQAAIDFELRKLAVLLKLRLPGKTEGGDADVTSSPQSG